MMRTTAARAARKAASAPTPALLQLAVRVQPGASASEVTVSDAVGENLLHLSARVTARAHDGEANDALRRLLADSLGVSRSRVTIVRGLRSRDKVVAVDGMTRDDVLAVLGTET